MLVDLSAPDRTSAQAEADVDQPCRTRKGAHRSAMSGRCAGGRPTSRVGVQIGGYARALSHIGSHAM
jgi:hypothetical protein